MRMAGESKPEGSFNLAKKDYSGKMPFPYIDGLAKSFLGRLPGEPRIRSGAGAGVQKP